MPDVSLGLVLVVASASVFGPLSGWLAGQRRRNIALWTIFGIVLGPIAPGLLVSAPPGQCAACRWPVTGWGSRCSACGADVRTGAAIRSEPGAPAAPRDQPIAEPPAHAEPALQAVPARARSSRTRRAAEPRTARPKATPPRPDLRAVEGQLEWSPRVPATRLGHRPDEPRPVEPSPPVAPEAPAGALAILGSGVYVGGNRPILAGNRYLLARVAGELQILGPVHLDPGAVADRVALDAIDAFVLDGRLVIGGRDAKTDVTMAFVAVSQEREGDIIAALHAPESAASGQ